MYCLWRSRLADIVFNIQDMYFSSLNFEARWIFRYHCVIAYVINLKLLKYKIGHYILLHSNVRIFRIKLRNRQSWCFRNNATTHTWQGVTWFRAALSPYQSRARPRAVRTEEGRKGTARLVSVSGPVCRPPLASYVMLTRMNQLHVIPRFYANFVWTWFSINFLF